ncbi:MAG: hypothetical protein ILNGONEN_00427 [Syntrophorhabdaceae bacterium]|nr:hypothetical protein [Syntrophorhabdaceae bacterium]
MVHRGRADDRLFVLHFAFVTIEIFDRIFVAEHALDINALGVRAPAFLNPRVGHVVGRHAVAKPLVPAFVNDNEIELRAHPDAGPIAAEIAVLKQIAVAHRALMLHAGIRHFDQFVAIFFESILTEMFLKAFDHRLGLAELALRRFEMIRQRIKIQRQIAKLIAKMRVLRNIQ